MLTFAIIGVTLVGVLALFCFGGWEERLVGVLVLALLVLVPLLEPLQIGTWRAGIAALELVFLIAILWLTYARDRWWLTALAGFQLISVLTHLVPLLADGRHFVWTAVTIRMEVWLLICITFFVGAWEAWAARRFAREGGSHAQDKHPSSLVDLDAVQRP
ncbi:hypothetical protein [Brevundimonas sp. M20]|uniref:hypothetical protein n=1 Tax=Brevundimonas sp. M20 TaxID=2591463 RepID=UPI00114661A9|nr:hypothetical protein [Brevundimonas sp. M20]QDH72080.1 hypothetical protein FKQ52_00775 [Brevundimonas sp. M20]